MRETNFLALFYVNNSFYFAILESKSICITFLFNFTMNTAGIVFLSLGILLILMPIVIALAIGEYQVMLLSLLSIVCFMLFPIVNYPDPTKNDVKEGKAIYVEEVNVALDANGDTLYNYSTYRLEWLPEWKYGRKHERD